MSDARRYVDLALGYVNHYTDSSGRFNGLAAWRDFNAQTAGKLSRDEKSLVFKYATVLTNGKKYKDGRVLVRPGDKAGAKDYIRGLIRRRVNSEMKGPARAVNLITRGVPGFDVQDIMKRKRGGKMRASTPTQRIRNKIPEYSDSEEGDGYDGEGYDDRVMSMYRGSGRRRGRRKGHKRGILGGFFDEPMEEYVGNGFDNESDDDDYPDDYSDDYE